MERLQSQQHSFRTRFFNLYLVLNEEVLYPKHHTMGQDMKDLIVVVQDNIEFTETLWKQ